MAQFFFSSAKNRPFCLCHSLFGPFWGPACVDLSTYILRHKKIDIEFPGNQCDIVLVGHLLKFFSTWNFFWLIFSTQKFLRNFLTTKSHFSRGFTCLPTSLFFKLICILASFLNNVVFGICLLVRLDVHPCPWLARSKHDFVLNFSVKSFASINCFDHFSAYPKSSPHGSHSIC